MGGQALSEYVDAETVQDEVAGCDHLVGAFTIIAKSPFGQEYDLFAPATPIKIYLCNRKDRKSGSSFAPLIQAESDVEAACRALQQNADGNTRFSTIWKSNANGWTDILKPLELTNHGLFCSDQVFSSDSTPRPARCPDK